MNCEKCYNENICSAKNLVDCDYYVLKSCYNCKFNCKVDREDCETWELQER